eukprot:6492542-Amphidinium_carterae.1
MASASEWKPVLFLEHCLYDETPLGVRIDYGVGKSCGLSGADHEIAKVFVVESSFTVVIERCTPHTFATGVRHFCTFELCMSPQLRAAANATGETCYEVLRTCVQPSSHVESIFPHCCRLVEVDEGPANNRTETLLERDRSKHWLHFLSLCLGHKTHAAASKSWSLQEETVRNLIHTCKVLGMAGSTQSLKEAVKVLVRQRFETIAASMEDMASKEHKETVLKYFMPTLRTPRKRALVQLAAKFFNSNWKMGNVVHHVCHGPPCCSSKHESACKATIILMKLIGGLKPKMFSKSNWLDWVASTRFYGILAGMHGVLQALFGHAFGGASLEDADTYATLMDVSALDTGFDMLQQENLAGLMSAQTTGEDDKMQLERIANAYSVRVAVAWMQTGINVYLDVFCLRVSLEPQQNLMALLLHQLSYEWEEEQVGRLVLEGHRKYRFTELHDEAWRTHIFKLAWRPAAVIFQLIMVRCMQLPYALFKLLDPNTDKTEVAAALLNTPLCKRDGFSKRHMRSFNTVAKLTSAESIAILTAIAKKGQASIYTTERLHSGNLRWKKARSSTHQPDVAHLALGHMAHAYPKWSGIRPAGKNESQRKSSAIAGPTAAEATGELQKKRRGGGGAWRAYVQHQTQGVHIATEDFVRLRSGYRQLTAEQREWYKEYGKAGFRGNPEIALLNCTFILASFKV